jgi:hypothetical protein
MVACRGYFENRRKVKAFFSISQQNVVNLPLWGVIPVNLTVVSKTPWLFKLSLNSFIPTFALMIIIEDTLISDEIYTENFVCDLPVCNGGCCVHGDAGAPLEKTEIPVLKRIYPLVKPYMRDVGIETIEEAGTYVEDIDGEFTTPLVNKQECAYVFFDENNVAKCAIEMAWEEKVIDFKKPISCHLYPIRITKYSNYEAINYHRWPICDCARANGNRLKVRIYEFLKVPLIRKYGEDWYEQLDAYIKLSHGQQH